MLLVSLACPALAMSLAPLLAQERGQPEEPEQDEPEQEEPPIPLADRFRPDYEGRVFLLKVNLHQPEQGGHPAPWIDERGWHRRDVQRPVILHGGELVQVTGVFAYGDRSIFLELTRWPFHPWGGDPVRARIRFQTESAPEEPGEQDEQISRLIARVLGRAQLADPRGNPEGAPRLRGGGLDPRRVPP